MQLTLALPTPRQPARRAAQPDAARTRLQAQHARRLALVNPPEEQSAPRTLADMLFVDGRDVSDRTMSISGSPAGRAWITACLRDGLVERVTGWGLAAAMTGRTDVTYRATTLGLRLSCTVYA